MQKLLCASHGPIYHYQEGHSSFDDDDQGFYKGNIPTLIPLLETYFLIQINWKAEGQIVYLYEPTWIPIYQRSDPPPIVKY